MLEKIQTKLRKLNYRLRKDFLTLNNIVFAAALLIALSWTWSSIETMQRNYELQQLVDSKKHQVTLEKLRVDTLALEGKYYNTLEYQELAVRERLGKAMPGEHLLIVPSTDASSTAVAQPAAKDVPKNSNFQEWMNFLFGTKRPDLPK